MSHTDKEKQKDLERLHDAVLWVMTKPEHQRYWNSVEGFGDQLIHRVGHSFTTIPRFDDDVHDRLTARFKETMKEAGCIPEAIENCRFMIDRVEGDVTIDLPYGTHERIVEQLAAFRERTMKERK